MYRLFPETFLTDNLCNRQKRIFLDPQIYTDLLIFKQGVGQTFKEDIRGGLAEDSMIGIMDLSFSLFRYLMIN